MIYLKIKIYSILCFLVVSSVHCREKKVCHNQYQLVIIDFFQALTLGDFNQIEKIIDVDSKTLIPVWRSKYNNLSVRQKNILINMSFVFKKQLQPVVIKDTFYTTLVTSILNSKQSEQSITLLKVKDCYQIVWSKSDISIFESL